MEEFIVDKEQWIPIPPVVLAMGMAAEHQMKFDRKVKSTIRLFLSNLVLSKCLERSYNQVVMRKVRKFVSI